MTESLIGNGHALVVTYRGVQLPDDLIADLLENDEIETWARGVDAALVHRAGLAVAVHAESDGGEEPDRRMRWSDVDKHPWWYDDEGWHTAIGSEEYIIGTWRHCYGLPWVEAP